MVHNGDNHVHSGVTKLLDRISKQDNVSPRGRNSFTDAEYSVSDGVSSELHRGSYAHKLIMYILENLRKTVFLEKDGSRRFFDLREIREWYRLGNGGMGPWAFGVPLVLVSALGLLLNAYVLLVVGLTKQTQQQQTTNTVLLIHLGAVEAAVCLVLLVFTTGGWNVAGTSCVLHGFLLALLHPVALWTVTGLNCDRYYAIAAPLHYAALVSPRRVAVGLAASWTGALLLCLPPFSGLVPPYAYSPGLGCCAPDFGNSAWGSAAAWYGAVYAFLGLGLPAVLVTVCNLRVLGIARYHRHRIASAIYEVTLSAQVTITHQRNPFSFVPTVTAPTAGGPPRFHSAATTVMQLVGSLYLLYFPYCGMIVWEACGAGIQPHLQIHPKFASVASLLLACSPPVNGLLYGLKSRTLRRSVQNYWRKKATKSELQQEIQARTPSVAGSRRPSGSGAPFLPFPPLQRRLSEALISFASYRSGNNFESRNIRNTFHRNRLQPAASCNTLRVPTSESGETGRLVRSSASAASLMGAHYQTEVNGENATTNFDNNVRSKCDAKSIETPKRSPRILITRAYSEESQGGGSPLLRKPFGSNVTTAAPFEKRRWRHRSTGSDSSTGSSEGGIWTTGVAPKIAKANVRSSTDIWPMGRRFTKVKTLEEGAIFSAVRPNNNSESSDTTDTTATTVTTTSTLLTRPLQEERQKESENLDSLSEIKKGTEREDSESEGSWCSPDEDDKEEDGEDDDDDVIETSESDNKDKTKNRRKQKDKSKNVQNVPMEDSERAAQLRPLLTSSS